MSSAPPRRLQALRLLSLGDVVHVGDASHAATSPCAWAEALGPLGALGDALGDALGVALGDALMARGMGPIAGP